MPLILPGNVGSATAATGYNVANSVRFNPGDSAYMHKTPSAGNRQKATFSCWVKRSLIGSAQTLFWAGSDNSNYQTFPRFLASDKLVVGEVNSGSTTWEIVTDRVFRDVSAWYHIVIAMDTTQGTAANRIKIYVNGVQETSLDTSGGYPAEDRNTLINTGVPHQIGHDYVAQYYGGYVDEACFLEAAQSAPTDFGEFDGDSPTIWKPIDVSGLTFGTNGFYLDFEASGNLGNDANGGTDLTEVNLAATDQSTDTCTNNFATLNPLNYGTNFSFSEANLQIAQSASNWDTAYSSIGVTSGKWYMEYKGKVGAYHDIGVTDVITPTTNPSVSTGGVAWKSNSEFARAGSVSGQPSNVTSPASNTYTNDDIIGIALDMDNEAVYFRKNGGDWEVNSDPESGASKTGAVTLPNSGSTYFFAFAAYKGSAASGTGQVNFGGGSVDAISSGNTDADGHGNFEHAPPSGYFALCTKNLAEYG